MATRNVVLTDRQNKMIDALVKSGRYQNASEVLREGLRLVEQREAEDAAKLKALREAARQGEASIAAGDYVEFANAKQLDQHLKKLAAKAIDGAKRRR
jgi:antitoxin ParD1/3/4